MSSPLVFSSAYSSVEEILVMLGLDIILRDERSNGFMEQITCIIFVLDPLGKMAGNSSDIRLWPRLDRTGEMRFLARGKSGRRCDEDLSIRCTVNGCSCESFTPGKRHLRYCENCHHGWVPHVSECEEVIRGPVGHCVSHSFIVWGYFDTRWPSTRDTHAIRTYVHAHTSKRA
ncbi:BNC1 protein, partial [Acromyrmex heyeri]